MRKFYHLTSPSVTTVGGTTNVPEVAVTRFFSGGGFSNYVSCRWPEAYQLDDQLKIQLLPSFLDLPTKKRMSPPI